MWFSIVLLGSNSEESDLEVICQILFLLNAQSTRHGARPGPILAPSCTGGPPACPAAESARKDSRPEDKSLVLRKKIPF